jgi:hypothetical protein
MNPVSRSGLGTGEPQQEQKYERKPLGFCHCVISGSPLIHWNLSAATINPVFDTEPPCLRHSEQ